ncbi:hypothetical protein A2303_00195 [Candidatus Falkowbacteria bacterium RIFOXYB2_FULL_47_14]|uniref:Uncharacterized protein n=1 Tax=Candidatus Falkowbacteria bacterium RIFOXYA2_FULL_47_19 TaxID=1797994 RepID=A0A1F5SN60_9BACT|nr:MAG: hypothetical protein A2227_01475 [Candidatus Falkowbacteria bacterium RIFOXYA2_FULL_47_19]OGF44075.1 MAG: hypothetical protein A2303_00195 [Candidatus Falkowbacteria bacterium RIFOXYB2_FULL_47_14]
MATAIISFFIVFIALAAMVNYLDTGKVYTILPGQKLRFWSFTVGISLFISMAIVIFLRTSA